MDKWEISLEEAQRRIQHAKETGATELNVSWCEDLVDLSPLSCLHTLQNLDLTGCRQLSDLSPLAGLQTLQILDLSGCEQLSGLSPLAGLHNLQDVSLYRNLLLSDLSPLSGLQKLQSLDLIDCPQITDLSPLADLQNLRRLSFMSNAVPLDSLLLLCWPRLEVLYVQALQTAPKELGTNHPFENCLPRLQAWETDLRAGEANNSELKVFVLGNGGAGKTQICRRLRGEAFDASIESTHGIQLGRVELWSASNDEKGLTANLWDFGGQDIYHGTHALFMDERAVYVVVWNPALEQASEYEEQGVAMQHRPLAYWLAMVRSVAGEDAAVIVVQSQCDEQQQRATPPLPADHGFQHLLTTTSSALKARGMEKLLVELRSQAELLQERFGQVLLPAGQSRYWPFGCAPRQECLQNRWEPLQRRAFRAVFCQKIAAEAAPT